MATRAAGAGAGAAPGGRPLGRREFDYRVSSRSLGFDRIQTVARWMVFPMLLMGLMAIGTGLGVGIARASEITDGGSAATIAELGHIQQGALFLGLGFLFGAISFAIGRIVGQFRKGGGDIQEAARRQVHTLRRPYVAWTFLGLMMMGMMVVIIAAVLHFAFAADVGGSAASLAEAEDRFTVLLGVERIGIAMFLAGIAFGLATIVHVLRFQARRVRELPDERQASSETEASGA